MEDVSKELLELIQDAYKEELSKSKLIDIVKKKIKEGSAVFEDAYEASGDIGLALSMAYDRVLSSSILPNGKMYYNIADRTIRPTLEYSYAEAADIAQQVQACLNKRAKLGIKAQRADGMDRIDGIINRISSEDSFDDIKWITQEPVRTMMRSVVDDTIKKNAGFHAKAGLTPRIIRKSSGKCCKWCLGIVGTYKYPDVPKDVYRRHDNCKCMVDYNPGDGKIQSVHTGKEGKRTYVQDKYGGYEKTKEARIAHAKEMAATEEARKAAAREKRIATWDRKKKDYLLEKRNINGTIKADIDSNADERFLTDPIEKAKLIREAISAKKPFYAKELRRAYEMYGVKAKDGYQDILIHGATSYVEYEHKYILDCETLYLIISGRKDYHPELNDIRLLACNTGKEDKNGYCIAKDLANRLGVNVLAPIDTLNINPDGTLTVGVNDLPEDEGLKIFRPGGD